MIHIQREDVSDTHQWWNRPAISLRFIQLASEEIYPTAQGAKVIPIRISALLTPRLLKEQ
jgi:hypothetical protein